MTLHPSCSVPSGCLFSCLSTADTCISSLDVFCKTQILGTICPLNTSKYMSHTSMWLWPKQKSLLSLSVLHHALYSLTSLSTSSLCLISNQSSSVHPYIFFPYVYSISLAYCPFSPSLLFLPAAFSLLQVFVWYSLLQPQNEFYKSQIFMSHPCVNF